MEVDNLKMDMSGVELSVTNCHKKIEGFRESVTDVEGSLANLHHQIQRVEDEVVKPLSEKVTAHYHDFFTSGGSMESRFEGLIDGHGERLAVVEQASAVAAEKCDSVREVLTSWMMTFEALEGNVGKAFNNSNIAFNRIKDIEDWLEPNSRSIVEAQEQIASLADLVKDQASTIRLLQDRVGELELGHGVLRAHVINIEVGR
jgi:chromosome segregation ATPase